MIEISDALDLIFTFGILIIALLSFHQKKN
ncbi:putative holin-like toxin [Lutispora saccharofermentans]|uniref:Holin-like toxin n=1 Tax=Lutispora saccharofermentans TaxID=3024236 RepID=A0ABT1NDT7_9FIRM|nr:putative holin-like toxin [Lutispora saccharofermentans]MCQ1529418.1 putative holin-like toxin [Lutispora saccharofermentans]